MANDTLPPCGIYKTTAAIGQVPAGRLVLFHNHGNPGPGIYLPASWKRNRAQFSQQGTTLPNAELAKTLRPLLAEGLYRVGEEFTCCEKRCRTYERDLMVQLGYNGAAEAILFVPEWGADGINFPETGQKVDDLRLTKLEFLLVAQGREAPRTDYH